MVTIEFAALLIVGAAAGGFVNGLAGFGTSLFALCFWLQIMPPTQAVAAALVVSVASGAQGVYLIRKAIEPRRLAWFLAPALFGIPIGLQLLHRIDGDALKAMIAAFLLLYGGYFSLRRALPRWSGEAPLIDGSVGFVGGVLGAVAGLSGVAPTMWVAMRGWSKERSRAVLQPFNFVVLALSAISLAIAGAYDDQTLLLLAAAVPIAMASTRLGIWLFKRLSNDQFQRLLVALLFATGVGVLISEAWGALAVQ